MRKPNKKPDIINVEDDITSEDYAEEVLSYNLDCFFHAHLIIKMIIIWGKLSRFSRRKFGISYKLRMKILITGTNNNAKAVLWISVIKKNVMCS
ncbi:hypothetical protein C0J52_28011 [Blattella germanica]|nr:hypothetical protein C0J52_28011 [Blattella germanica]